MPSKGYLPAAFRACRSLPGRSQRAARPFRAGASLAGLHTASRLRRPEDGSQTPGGHARTDPTVRTRHAAPQETLGSESTTQGGRPLTLPSFSLAGKVCVVTGGARGLGLVMGKGIVASGADLAIVDLEAEEAARQAKQLVEEFQSEYGDSQPLPRITAHLADVSDPASVESCMADIVRQHGRVDGLVTSAGFTENYAAVDYPIARVRKLWAVNVDGTYLFATAVARHLMARGAAGSVVLIGSMSGSVVNVPQPQAPYNASKAAVRQLAASLAVEWAPAGIRVNCISPGYMLTALTEKILDERPDLKERWVSLTPQGRMGNPPDLMGPVVFLLSDAASYVTGADYRVDGGYTVT